MILKNETLIFKNEPVKKFCVRIKIGSKNTLNGCLFYYKTAVFFIHSADTLLIGKNAVNTDYKPFLRHKK